VVERLADLLEPASQITAHSLRHYAAPGILERSENLAAAQTAGLFHFGYAPRLAL
jgi:hypothetical protein